MNLLRHYSNQYIFTIINEDNVKKIKILAYFYQGDDHWEHVTFKNFEMPLNEWITTEQEDQDILADETKQYYEDMSEHQAAEMFRSYNAKGITLAELNEDTPEGVYVVEKTVIAYITVRLEMSRKNGRPISDEEIDQIISNCDYCFSHEGLDIETEVCGRDLL